MKNNNNKFIKMKKINLLIVLGFMFFGMISCQNDDAVDNSAKPGLMSALKNKGYTVSADGESLVVNEKVLQTKELDLAGEQLESIDGLEVFTALENLKLSNNKLNNLNNTKGVNLLKALKNIKTLDVSDNNIKIIDITGLINLENLMLQANDSLDNIKGLDVKANDKLVKLYLPKRAKYCRGEIVDFFIAHKAIDMQMESDKGMEKYTTKREIPDPVFRAFVQKKYPEVFDADGMLDLTKKFDITDANRADKTAWSKTPNNLPAWMADRYFDATGIKSIEGLQYFKNNVIRIWHMYNVEFESLDMSNDTIVESLRVGGDKVYNGFITTVSDRFKRVNIENCSKLKEIITEGVISKLSLKGCVSLEIVNFGECIEELDLTECGKIKTVYSMSLVARKISKLKKITFPVAKDWRGFMMLAIDHTEIAEIDMSKVKANSFFGMLLSLQGNVNLKKIKVTQRLGNGTGFQNSFFEEIDFRGATAWSSDQMKWIDASFVSNWFLNNPNLKIVNGKPYDSDED